MFRWLKAYKYFINVQVYQKCTKLKLLCCYEGNWKPRKYCTHRRENLVVKY